MEQLPFKSATELGISTKEHGALIEVLDMLESGKLTHVLPTDDLSLPRGEYLFSMNCEGWECGTPACIGGWVARLLKASPEEYVSKYRVRGSFGPPHPLYELYWNDDAISGDTTVAQAAQGLRNFLQTGEPAWAAVLEGD